MCGFCEVGGQDLGKDKASNDYKHMTFYWNWERYFVDGNYILDAPDTFCNDVDAELDDDLDLDVDTLFLGPKLL